MDDQLRGRLQSGTFQGAAMSETTMGRLAHFPATSGKGERTDEALAGTKSRLERILCRLRGHSTVLTFGSSSVFLRCTSCGHESAGWDVGPKRYVSSPVDAGARRTPYHLAFTVYRRSA
jgi:ribosomal protein S27E